MNIQNYKLCQDVIDACLWLEKNQFVIGTWGNVSVRCDEGFIITPSRMPYSKLKPEDCMIVSLDGTVAEGYNNPSSEKEVHRQIYLARPDVNAVIHGHSLYATGISCTGESIPPLTEEMSQLLGGEVYCTSEYVPAEQHFKLGLVTSEALKDKMAVLIKNHGPVCCGKTIEEAVTVCRVLEKSAHIYTNLRDSNKYITIEDEFVKSEHHRYLYTYGKEKV